MELFANQAGKGRHKDGAENCPAPNVAHRYPCQSSNQHLSDHRQTGLGMGSTMARVGSIVSPLVSMTAEFYPSIPLFIFGAVPVAASAVTALLPETLGQPLPDTVQDLKSR